jgi:Ca2+/Na+ antiporter
MYTKKPKLTENKGIAYDLTQTGVAVSKEIRHGGVIMALTTIPYFLIQVPASFLHGPAEEVARGEHWYALGAFAVCLVGLIMYMRLQLHFSEEGQDKDRRIAICKRALQDGKLSLKGALQANLKSIQAHHHSQHGGQYSSLTQSNDQYPPPPADASSILKEILLDSFKAYDKDGNNQLERSEIKVFFHDFHENIGDDEIDAFVKKTDVDGDDAISFDEFVTLAYHLIMSSDESEPEAPKAQVVQSPGGAVVDGVFEEDDGEEEEEVPEDITHLSPEEQQTIIKWRAFKMLAIGTVMVIYFSDPMVDVMQEIAVRAHMSPFYVSFILAPLASNASEFVASMFYAAKKTRKTMTVSLSALEGAACMNNTFCLSIFMFLIFYRGLAWQFTAETISIVVVELIMTVLVRSEVMTTLTALGVLAILPLSLVLVATLEYFGFD